MILLQNLKLPRGSSLLPFLYLFHIGAVSPEGATRGHVPSIEHRLLGGAIGADGFDLSLREVIPLRGGAAKRKPKTTAAKQTPASDLPPAATKNDPQAHTSGDGGPRIFASNPVAAKLLGELNGVTVMDPAQAFASSRMLNLEGAANATSYSVRPFEQKLAAKLPTGLKQFNTTAAHLAFLELIKKNKSATVVDCSPLGFLPDPGIAVTDGGLSSEKDIRSSIQASLHSALIEGCETFDVQQSRTVEKLFGEILTRTVAQIPGGRLEVKVMAHINLTENNNANPTKAIRTAADALLKRMKLSFLDVIVLHWPASFTESEIDLAWKAMESLYEDGLAHGIGFKGFPRDIIRFKTRRRRVRPVVFYLDPRYGSAVSGSDIWFIKSYVPSIQVVMRIPSTLEALPDPLPDLARILKVDSASDLVRAYLMSRDVAVFHPIQEIRNITELTWNTRVAGMNANEKDLALVGNIYGLPLRRRIYNAMARFLPFFASVSILYQSNPEALIASTYPTKIASSITTNLIRLTAPQSLLSAHQKATIALGLLFLSANVFDRALRVSGLLPRRLQTSLALTPTALLALLFSKDFINKTPSHILNLCSTLSTFCIVTLSKMCRKVPGYLPISNGLAQSSQMLKWSRTVLNQCMAKAGSIVENGRILCQTLTEAASERVTFAHTICNRVLLKLGRIFRPQLIMESHQPS
mmetsp:Transcript_15456/g.38044  ORF Transcript_15456/g.38044 Transcript_15456/m.38044 type:complete len:695 (+) Transcript_15456:332-2416(+)